MKTLTVDGCSICQLKCPQCPASQMGYKNTIGKGWLSFESFKKLLSLNPRIAHVEFDNFGELFLNPDLLKILKYAFKEKVMLSCAGGVNLNDVSNEVLEALVRFRFQYLNISIDGCSQETYAKYRVGGDWDTVINNICKINMYKKQYNTPYPKLQWQFIVFGHNEHEIEDARAMAGLLGMRFWPKMNWNSQYSPIEDPEFVKKETGWDVITREQYEKKHGVNYMRATCYSLWNSPRYSWDLSVTGCCWNVWDRFDQKSIKYAKDALTDSDVGFLRSFPCNICGIYKGLERTGQYLSKLEILSHLYKSRMATNAKYLLWRYNK